MIPQETEMSCGWPLGLEIINLRLGQSPLVAEPMRLTSYSSASSSNSETVWKKMVLLEKLWDDLVDRSEANCRLAGLRKITTPPLIIADVRGGGKFKKTKSSCSAALVTPTAPVCKDSYAARSAGAYFHNTHYNGLEQGARGKQPMLT